MAKKKENTPATTSMAYDAMLPKWLKIKTVLAGTSAMRGAGKAYLPQHYKEANSAYKERLARNTLLNLTKITLDSWVGRPFSDPIKFEKVPPDIETMLLDADLQGNDVHVFCREWFRNGLANALGHIFVDHPRLEEGRTRADDLKENVRPFWRHVQPEDLIFADVDTIDGKEVLREIRVREQIVQVVDFAEEVVEQIRQIKRMDVVPEDGTEPVSIVMVIIWRVEDPKARKKKWIVYEKYPFGLPIIPLVTFYADRQEFMIGTPPLEDLAELNVAHWQSTSDQRAVLTVARFPILAYEGSTPDEGLEVGPHAWLSGAGKFYYVEHSGKSIEAGRKDIESLESQMAEYGAEFLKKRPGGMTATARALDSAEATSPLQDMTIRFMHSVDTALEYTAMWLNKDLPDEAKAVLATDFGPEEATTQVINALLTMRKQKDISREAFIAECVRLGLLDEDFDAEADKTKLENEVMDMFGAQLPDDNPDDPNEPDEPDDDDPDDPKGGNNA